jgi:hypothetical protein
VSIGGTELAEKERRVFSALVTDDAKTVELELVEPAPPVEE